jgi:nitroimidazol reductase NimA-like FMN-containing flavoprotein (pyridoxamine 5'-phosphate oxidase superfamily)
VDLIRGLVTTQPYGVLATHGDGQAYGSLVAFAFTEDLREAFFATSVATRKYELLSRNDGVALVVDNRPAHVGNMMEVEAITVTGRAQEIPPGPHRAASAQRLVARHPQLRSFVAAASCAMFRIEVARFLHVTRFQEVRQWVPGQT